MNTRSASTLGVLILIAAGGGSAFYLTRHGAGSPSGKTASAGIRTATVSFGDVRKTVRVAGTISAERFAALLAPQLRGSRTDRGRGGSAAASASSSTATTTSTASSTSAAGTTSTSSSSSSSTNAASTTPGAVPAATASSLGPQRGTTNRFNDAASQASTQTSSSAQSATSTSADLGSTSGNLFSPSASGGSTTDFTLVLMDAADGGAHVKKGDVVAAFDRQYMLLRLDDYKDSVTQLDANVKKLKADLAVAKEAHDQQVRSAKADLDKAELDLKTISVRSAIESEDFKMNAEEARARNRQMQQEVKLFDESQRAQLRDAELDLQQAVIELKRAETNIDRMTMRAPFDGIVVMQTLYRGGDFGQVKRGDQIWPGMNFMSIVDPGSMVVNATVNQADSELLRLGMQASVRLDAYPDLELPATVIGIGAMTKPAGWRGDFFKEIPVRLKLDRTDPRVLPDLSASAAIVIETEARTSVIPLEAVFRDRGDGRPFVFVRTPAGWVRKDVQLGLSNQVAVAVHSGVESGDVIAIERPL